MSLSDNRRRFSRIAFMAHTEIHQGDQSWCCELLDLSLKGLLVSEPKACSISADATCQIAITLTDDTTIKMKASLARQEQGHLGFVCQEIDVDSISHLRRLVELNIGNPEASNRELFELMAVNADEAKTD
jgi:PilZ domain-containing protein